MKSGIEEGMEQNPVDEERNPSNISEEVTYSNLSHCSAARGLPSPYPPPTLRIKGGFAMFLLAMSRDVYSNIHVLVDDATPI
jgi:hypothetical protein